MQPTRRFIGNSELTLHHEGAWCNMRSMMGAILRSIFDWLNEYNCNFGAQEYSSQELVLTSNFSSPRKFSDDPKQSTEKIAQISRQKLPKRHEHCVDYQAIQRLGPKYFDLVELPHPPSKYLFENKLPPPPPPTLARLVQEEIINLASSLVGILQRRNLKRKRHNIPCNCASRRRDESQSSAGGPDEFYARRWNKHLARFTPSQSAETMWLANKFPAGSQISAETLQIGTEEPRLYPESQWGKIPMEHKWSTGFTKQTPWPNQWDINQQWTDVISKSLQNQSTTRPSETKTIWTQPPNRPPPGFTNVGPA